MKTEEAMERGWGFGRGILPLGEKYAIYAEFRRTEGKRWQKVDREEKSNEYSVKLRKLNDGTSLGIHERRLLLTKMIHQKQFCVH